MAKELRQFLVIGGQWPEGREPWTVVTKRERGGFEPPHAGLIKSLWEQCAPNRENDRQSGGESFEGGMVEGGWVWDGRLPGVILIGLCSKRALA
jgi:hypothetical protein